MRNDSPRWLVWSMWALALTPLVLLLVFLTLALHDRLGLGHGPAELLENHRSHAFILHERIFKGFACFVIWGTIPLWLALLCVRRFQRAWSWKPHFFQALVFLVGWCLIAAFAVWNPGHYVTRLV